MIFTSTVECIYFLQINVFVFQVLPVTITGIMDSEHTMVESQILCSPKNIWDLDVKDLDIKDLDIKDLDIKD